MKSRHLLLGLVFISLLGLVLWQLNRHPAAPAPLTQSKPSPQTGPQVSGLRTNTGLSEVGSSLPASSVEIVATARMYAAHAPLRVPEVADPDSATNKQILATMVSKALARPETPAPGSASTQP